MSDLTPGAPLTGSYDPLLVVLSLVIAVLSAYVSFDVAGRVMASNGIARAIWRLGGACTIGLGIWSMHATGMLAFTLPVAMVYRLDLITASIVIAIAASALLLWLGCRPRLTRPLMPGRPTRPIALTGCCVGSTRCYVGKGTGLGLSTSQAIVKAHGGFIRVRSEVGKGTTFEICLPEWSGRPSDLAINGATLPRGHGERVLVIDDEEAVRKVTRQALEAFGYTVLEASDGAEGVSAYAQWRDGIAAVIVDMMMPVLDGPATIQVLLKMNPQVRIIAASGVSQGRGPLAPVRAGVQSFLAKPYTAETLLRAQAAVVGRPSTS